MLDVIRPGDRRYEGARHVYTATGSPAAVVRPRIAAEVPDALAFAVRAGGAISVRSGGHGISSVSTNHGGTVVDLGALAGVEHLGGTRVRLGPGAHWGHVATALHPWGLAISSGDSGDVGVGGLATTAGIGLMSRAQGLTIDRLRSVDLVTADGVLRTVSGEEHPDLFWAVRGAGANVGIATSFVVEAARTPVVALATLAYQLHDPAGFLERWGALLRAAPREVSAFLYLATGGRGFAQATVVHTGADAARAAAALQPFVDLPGLVGQRASLTPYAAVPTTTDAPHTGQQRARSHNGLVDHLDRTAAIRLAALLASAGADMVQLRSVGGAVNDVPADATAYAHRHQDVHVAAMATGDRAAFDDAWAPVREVTDGMYLSFESAHHPGDVLAAFPPATLARLRALKARWDPTGVFTANFDVTPAAGPAAGDPGA